MATIKGTRVKEEFAATVGRWIYMSCSCFVLMESPTMDVSVLKRECDACGNTNLRFEHTLQSMDDKRQIRVGLQCACFLMDESTIPTLAENETKRKESWRRDVFNRPGRCSTTVDDLREKGLL
jgi:hypothetical protein